MKLFALATFVTTAAWLTGAMPMTARAEAPQRITGPVVHDNLAVYFIHGPSASGPVPLSLQEALEKGVVRVRETGSVNELAVENRGDEEVFIQSGDIVKGGQQDRVLTVSFVLPRHSGEVPIASFCVEHGRWTQRGREDPTQFASAASQVPSLEAKLAMRAPLSASPVAGQPSPTPRSAEVSERQRRVWDEVTKIQRSLSTTTAAPVAAPQSATSLQLSLENAKLVLLRKTYLEALKAAGERDDDIVGYAFAINGTINSADVYPSNALFRKMWGKLIEASVTEAIGAKAQAHDAPAPAIDAVQSFLDKAEQGSSTVQNIGGLAHQQLRDADHSVFIQAERPSGEWIHRNYLAR